MPRSRSRSRSRSPAYSVTPPPPPPARHRGRSRTRSPSPRRSRHRSRTPSPPRRSWRRSSRSRTPSPRSSYSDRRRSRSRTPPPPPRDSSRFSDRSVGTPSSRVDRWNWPVGARELWVGGLLHRTHESELYSLFSYYGPIESVRIHTAKSNQREYAFVAFRDWQDARDAALSEDGRRVGFGSDTQYLRVQYSRGSGTKNPITPDVPAAAAASGRSAPPPARLSSVNAMPIGGSSSSVPASPSSYASAGVLASEYRQASSAYPQPSLSHGQPFASDSMPPLESAYGGWAGSASSSSSFGQPDPSGYAQGYGEFKESMARQ